MSSKFIDSMRSFSRRSAAARVALAPAVAVRRMFNRRRRAIQQACYEHLRSRLVGDPVMAVAECHGDFELDVRSDLFKRLLFHGAYEADLMLLCERLIDPTRDALDIGANIGFFSVLMAKRLEATKRRVLSIEPTPHALKRLRGNVERNRVDDSVIIFDGVASNQPGQVEFTVVVGKEEYSCLSGARHPRIMGEEGQEYTIEKQSIQASTVDELVARHALQPGFFKVDVEGAELLVYQGAERTLREHRPVIMSELSASMLAKNGATIADVVGLLKRLDYLVIDRADPRAVNPTFDDAEMLAIPREKESLLKTVMDEAHD